jgi:hypothetical protein
MDSEPQINTVIYLCLFLLLFVFLEEINCPEEAGKPIGVNLSEKLTGAIALIP